jgi:hypothetical protein
MPEFSQFSSWDAFYHSQLQGWWLLWLAPIAFLAYRAWHGPLPSLAGSGDEGERTRQPPSTASHFVDLFALVFAAETLLDPVATGPLLRALSISDHAAGTGVMFLFVYLGDFRVLLLLFGLARPGPLAQTLRRAALATLAVPLVTGIVYGTLSLLHPTLHGQWQWIIYEVSFLTLALGIRGGWLPGLALIEGVESGWLRDYLREVCAYVAAYYAVWAGSDLLILLGGLDFGWATRAIANQLYYGFFVPFVWLRYRAASSAR